MDSENYKTDSFTNVLATDHNARRKALAMGCVVFLTLLGYNMLLPVTPVTDKSQSLNLTLVNNQASFGDLAAALAGPAFADVQSHVNDITSGTLDPNGGKVLRKALLRLRNILDIFSPTYFPRGNVDTWRDVRQTLAYGYEALGALHDLTAANVSYNNDDLTKAFEPVRQWQSQYTAMLRNTDAATYITSPSLDKLYLVKPNLRRQSPFFWGECHLEPRLKWSGLKNVAILTSQKLERFSALVARVLAMKSMITSIRHEEFHDSRKQARAVIEIAAMIPQLFCDAAQQDLRLLQLYYDKLGEVNDVWNHYSLMAAKGTKDVLGAQQVDQQLSIVQAWIKQNQVEARATDLRSKFSVGSRRRAFRKCNKL